MSSGRPLHGFRDFYPAELAQRNWLCARWREVVRRYGFVEYDGPPLEPVELYTAKSGPEIVEQLFDFTDKGGRHVTLRPEMTPTFARMVGAKAAALRKPVRWFSVPQLFRYEKAQQGRLREHFQLNVDIVGEADVTADAELVACAIDIMRACGLTSADVRVRVSDRRLLGAWLRALGVPDAAHDTAFKVLDKLERQPAEVSREKLLAAGVPESGIVALLAAATTTFDQVEALVSAGDSAEYARDFRRFMGYVDALVGEGGWLHFDLSIVRGLAYYTGIVFELFDAQGKFRAVAGGGRYDNLLGAIGGQSLPALGFGMGDVVLSLLLADRGKLGSEGTGLDYWIAAQGGDAASLPQVMHVAAGLRARGHRVEYALREQSASKQLKAAAAAGARFAVLLPPATPSDATIPAGHATVRDLATGDETQVLLATWLARD
jgi:histidyl-tRNA synthetase